MSPPLIDTEAPKKSKKACTAKQMIANRANAKRSRGPGPEAKLRTRYNEYKHNLRSESEVLHGEDGNELLRRLIVLPELMEVGNELEWLIAVRAVHMDWRVARANRSEDAAAERHMIELRKQVKDAEESATLGLVGELDSDVDPAGVVRKLHGTPSGCRALLSEWTCLQVRCDAYEILFWSQRERLFHLLGKRLRDLFKDDPVIINWIVAMMGAVFGDSEGDKAAQIGHVLEGLRPAWMDDGEYRLRMSALAGMLPKKAAATEKVRVLVAKKIADLKKRLKLAKANAKHELSLDLEKAQVNDTADGARRSNYKFGHVRSFDAELRRLKDLQKSRRAGGDPMADEMAGEVEAESESESEPAGGGATEPSPATGSPVREEPISAGAVDTGENDPTPSAAGGADDLLLTNDPNFLPAGPVAPGGNDPAPMSADGAADLLLTNDPNSLPAGPVAPGENDPTPPTARRADGLLLTNDPISLPVGPVAPGENDPTPMPAGGADDLLLTNDPISLPAGGWRRFLPKAPPMPPESEAPGHRAGEPPSDRPPD